MKHGRAIEDAKATIESVEGTTPGPAAGMSYTVRLTHKTGEVVIPGVRPRRPFWPNDLDINGDAMVGARVDATLYRASEGDRWVFEFIEVPLYGECP